MKLEEHGRRTSEGDERSPSYMSGIDMTNGSHPATVAAQHGSRTQLDVDSTDSDDTDEANKSRELQCPLEAQHTGKELLSVVVSLPIDTVFSLIFRQDQFMIEVYAARKTVDVTNEPWVDDDIGPSIRQVTYNMALPISTFNAKASFVTETQVLQVSQPGHVYVVESDVVNSGIPYGDAFTVFNHYCLTREGDAAAGRTHLVVYTSIKYKKPMWGLVKSMLEKNVYSGVEALLAEMGSHLTAEAEKAALTVPVRRKRKSTNAAQEPAIANTIRRQNSAHHPDGNGDGDGVSGWMAALVVVAVAVLASGNLFLLWKLWGLEQQSNSDSSSLLDFSASRFNMPGSWEGVAKILQRQEQFHERKVNHWRATLANANHKLVEIQESLEAIVKDIPTHIDSLKDELFIHDGTAPPRPKDSYDSIPASQMDLGQDGA